MTTEERRALEGLRDKWMQRRNNICRTVARCDSAKAFEVQRCAKELDVFLQAFCSPANGVVGTATD